MKLTKITVTVLIGIMLFFTIACGSNSALDFTTYTDTTSNFSISIPDSWTTLSMGSLGVLFSYNATCLDKAVGGGVMSTAPDISSLQDAHETVINRSEEHELVSEDEITIDGMPAWRIVYMDTNMSGGDNIQVELCFLVQGNRSFTLEFMSAPACWDQYESIFDTMLNSFQVLD